jgi:ribosomal protein S18 acetylase RimI-like enzyme
LKEQTLEVNIVHKSGDEFWAESAQLAAVYLTAFGPPPYNKNWSDSIRFLRSLNGHVRQAGFRATVAQLPGNNEIVGFAYGYDSTPGQWWHDIVRDALDPEVASLWLDGTFELVELAVTPNYQGRTIGRRLHDALLGSVPHQRALLSTLTIETTALRLYRRRGWITLLEELSFPNNERTYRIMGLELPLGKTENEG